MKKIVLAIIVLAALGGLAIAPLPLGDVTHIANSIVIAKPPEVVFAYVTTPANWPKWHPSSLAVSGATDHPLAMGEQVTEDFLVAGRKGRVLWTVTEREPGRKWSIAGTVGERKAGVVSYTLTPAGQGTRFDRTFDYSSPNLLFWFLNRLSIKEKVEAESAEAVRHLRANLES
jgi:uncharacterized protein YndB with AHSA1/START domain